MKRNLFFALAASVLLISVAAGSAHAHRHAHANLHRVKRGLAASSNSSEAETCGCTTIYSTWYGEATLHIPPPPPTTSTPPPPTTTVKPTSSAAAQYNVKPTQPPAPPPPPPPAIGGGPLWAFAYTPYADDGSCKSSGTVWSDITSLKGKGFTTVRIYQTSQPGCDILSLVGGPAKAVGLKLMVGIWIDGSGCEAASSEITDIISYFNGDYSMVEMVIVGNEVIADGYVSPGDLASFISTVRSTLRANGYKGPVSTTDTIAGLQSAVTVPGFCEELDIMLSNIHGFFNPNVECSGAGAFVAEEINLLSGLCPGNKPTFCTETGWPSAGDPNGAAVPGTQEQIAAIESIKSALGGTVTFFSFMNDLWKSPGPLDVEQNWGCASLF